MGIVYRIKVLCLEKEMSIGDLEEKLGFSKGSIYKWEKNSPSFDKIIKVAEFFDVSIDYLAGFNETYGSLTARSGSRTNQKDTNTNETVSQEQLDEVLKKISKHLSNLSLDELFK